MAEEKELREKLEAVKRKIMVMEWDQGRNQLNSGRLPIFNELKQEKAKIEQELTLFSEKEEDAAETGEDKLISP